MGTHTGKMGHIDIYAYKCTPHKHTEAQSQACTYTATYIQKNPHTGVRAHIRTHVIELVFNM